jgi:hypothetical protein
MDDHHPAGFWCTRHGAEPATLYKTPSPYGIPYRSLYSKNIENLMFSGRCASATHMAMSSARVMGTGCSMGQAAGTAAAMASAAGVPPAAVGDRIQELQQALLRDDAYLPWTPRRFGPLVTGADLSASSGDPEPLRDGITRPVGDDPHAWPCRRGDWVAYAFPALRRVEAAAVVLNSVLDKDAQLSYHQQDDQLDRAPPEMQKAFHLDVRTGGAWRTIARVTENHQRLVRLEVGQSVEAVRWVLDETWGAEETRLFALDLE